MRAGKTDAAPPDDNRRKTISLVCIATLVVCAQFDIFNIGFFADDYLFLDAARRMPASEVLIGQHGIFPWYRPLSRELFFYLLIAAEPFSTYLAHALSLL